MPPGADPPPTVMKADQAVSLAVTLFIITGAGRIRRGCGGGEGHIQRDFQSSVGRIPSLIAWQGSRPLAGPQGKELGPGRGV